MNSSTGAYRRKSGMACVPFFSSSEALSPSEIVSQEDLDTLTEPDIFENMGENLAECSVMLPTKVTGELQAQYINNLLEQNGALRANFEQVPSHD